MFCTEINTVDNYENDTVMAVWWEGLLRTNKTHNGGVLLPKNAC